MAPRGSSILVRPYCHGRAPSLRGPGAMGRWKRTGGEAMVGTRAKASSDLAPIERSIWLFDLSMTIYVLIATPSQVPTHFQATKQGKIGFREPIPDLATQPNTPKSCLVPKKFCKIFQIHRHIESLDVCMKY